MEWTSPERKQGGCCTDPLLFDTDNYSLGEVGDGGVSAGQDKSILKISFHSLRRGCVGAAVEKRVISTAAGEQKAASYRREEKRRRNGDAGPEGTSEWPTLRG